MPHYFGLILVISGGSNLRAPWDDVPFDNFDSGVGTMRNGTYHRKETSMLRPSVLTDGEEDTHVPQYEP